MAAINDASLPASVNADVLATMDVETRQHRAALMAEGGPLARAMRAIESRTWQAGWLLEIWQWVGWVWVVRGLRGRSTVATYVGIMGRFGEWLGPRGLNFRDVSLIELDTWQKSLYIERRNGSAYRRQTIQALRSFYKWRESRGMGRDCTKGLVGPRKISKTPKKYSGEDLKALFVAAKHAQLPLTAQRNHLMILVLMAAGLRREELAGLTLDQLELGNNTGIIHVLGKGAKERDVPIEGPVVKQLQEWLVMRAGISGIQTDCVFFLTRAYCFGQAMQPQAVERLVSSVARSAGLRSWGVHRFRITFATTLYDDGADIERIRIVMGHESIETTRRYLAVSRRMRDVRLKTHRQHAALGTRHPGFPLWAKQLQEQGGLTGG